jgi:hypothetical protein
MYKSNDISIQRRSKHTRDWFVVASACLERKAAHISSSVALPREVSVRH